MFIEFGYFPGQLQGLHIRKGLGVFGGSTRVYRRIVGNKGLGVLAGNSSVCLRASDYKARRADMFVEFAF